MRLNAKTFRSLGIASLLALVVGASGCRSEGGRTAGQTINDKMTAYNVNRALDRDPVVKFPDVKVNVYNGNAQLTGFVNTEQQRARAAEIAAGVQGVTQVLNEIAIKPEPTGRATIRDVNPESAPTQAPPPPR